MMMTINSTLDIDTATTLARAFGAEVETRSFEEEMIGDRRRPSTPKDLVTRAPVVTVMGHVDHGKTTLLDAIRNTRVAEREAGGITQHIGAYLVPTRREGGKHRVPRHAGPRGVHADARPRREGHRRGGARRRGRRRRHAADAGRRSTTRKAANVPIIVAVNKIDKPGANPETVKRQLTDLGLMPEDWGGQTVIVEVSAKKKTEPRAAARDDPARHRNRRAQGQPEAQRDRHRARDQARSRPRPGGDRARAGRHAARRRQRHRRPHRRHACAR